MELLFMQFSPAVCYLLSLRSKHFPQHPVLKHPQCRAGTRGRQAWQLPGAQRLITIFLISVNSSLCGTYFCDTSTLWRKTDGQILSLDIYPSSSEYDIAKTIHFNDVIDKFASVKARKVTL
jgi:hypothetical protein